MNAVLKPCIPAIPPGFQAPPVLEIERALRTRIAGLEAELQAWRPPPPERGHQRFSTVLERFPVVVDFEWSPPDGDRPAFIEIARVWVNGQDIGADLGRDQIDKLTQYANRHYLDELNEQRILEKTT
jgi:hypothetical protein